MQIINWSLIKHPMNWVILLLMIVIAGITIHIVLDFYNVNPAPATQK
jgi:hypothetical protein